MPYRPGRKQPEFADLKGILAQYRDPDNSLYQVVQEIIERLTQFSIVLNDEVDGKIDTVDAVKRFASKFPTYHTKDDETALLPNSVQLLAGTNITFDDSVPNARTISASGGGGASDHYDCPLSDGDTSAADLIFAAGECIIVQVPI